jgi:hypothetical protein
MGIQKKHLWHLKKDLTACVIYWSWTSYKLFLHEYAKFHHFEKNKWANVTDVISNVAESQTSNTNLHPRRRKSRVKNKKRSATTFLSRQQKQDDPTLVQWGWRNIASHVPPQKIPRTGPLDRWLTQEDVCLPTLPNSDIQAPDCSVNTENHSPLSAPAATCPLEQQAACCPLESASFVQITPSKRQHLSSLPTCSEPPNKRHASLNYHCAPSTQANTVVPGHKRLVPTRGIPYYLNNLQTKKFKEYFQPNKRLCTSLKSHCTPTTQVSPLKPSPKRLTSTSGICLQEKKIREYFQTEKPP